MLGRRPGLGPGQHICTPSSPEKWQRVQRGNGVNGGHTSRPGSGTARRTLESVIVVGCHLPLFLFVCLGVASAGRRENGCALGDWKRVTHPTGVSSLQIILGQQEAKKETKRPLFE